jgi:hypothetical protein
VLPTCWESRRTPERAGSLEPGSGTGALVGKGWRQPDVEDDDVRLVSEDEALESLRRPDRGDDLVCRVPE